MVNRRSCRWLPPVARGPLSEKEGVDSEVPTSSDERNVVGAADCPAFDDVGVDADIRMIVLRCGAQDAGIFGEVSLRQRGHDATRTRARDPQANLVADRDRVADPVVLDEALLIGPRRNNDVRPKAPHLEASLRIQQPEYEPGRAGPSSE